MLDWSDYAKVLAGLIVVLDPIGTIPLFMAVTSDQTTAQRRRTALVAAFTVTLVLIIAALVGEHVLALFGVRIATFRVGGGILILLMAISMMHAKTSGAVQTPEEARLAYEKDAVAVVPLAIPLLAGPGAISAVIIFAHRGSGVTHLLVLGVVIVLAAFLSWLALRLATVVQPLIGPIGIKIVSRLMGLILAAVAVEFMVNGLIELFPGLRGLSIPPGAPTP